MKKKQNYGINNQKPIQADGDANGPVKVYYLTKEELAPYLNLHPPTDASGKRIKRGHRPGGVA